MSIITLTSIADINNRTKLFEITSIGIYQIELDITKIYRFLISNPVSQDSLFGGEDSIKPLQSGSFLIGEKFANSDNISYRQNDSFDVITNANYLVIKINAIKISPVQVRLLILN